MHPFLFVRLNAPASLCKSKCTSRSPLRAFNFTTHTFAHKLLLLLDIFFLCVILLQKALRGENAGYSKNEDSDVAEESAGNEVPGS